MQNNRSLIISALMFFLYLFITVHLSAQVSSNKTDKNKLVYWFYVDVKEVKDKTDEHEYFSLKKLSTKPEHGNLIEYDRQLWENISEGSKLAVGPFNEFNEARTALLFYQIQDELHVLDTSINMNQQIFWFVLRVERRERSNAIFLERIPAAIASGTYRDFEIFLKENLQMKIMTIGPFLYMPEAEESKRIYRLH